MSMHRIFTRKILPAAVIPSAELAVPLARALPQQAVLGGFQEAFPIQSPLLPERTLSMGADAGEMNEGVVKHGGNRR